MKDRRLQIGLYTCNLDNEFSQAIINGVMLAARQRDVNLFILPTKNIDGKYAHPDLEDYDYQYGTLMAYASPEGLDAIIFEAGTIGSFVTPEDLVKLLSTFENIPVVSVAQELASYYSMKFNTRGLEAALEHLITEHGRKRIGFVGGPRTNTDAIARLETYKKVLARHGLEFDRNLYEEGNFFEFCQSAVEALLDRNEGNIDAICFANDRMAIGGYEVLKKRGIRIGEDISVIGFDDAPSAATMSPRLTTVRSDISALGFQAVDRCISLIRGEKPKEYTVDTEPVYRQSCGCKDKEDDLLRKLQEKGREEEYSSEKLCNDMYELLSGDVSYSPERNKKIQEILDDIRRYLELLEKKIRPDSEHMYLRFCEFYREVDEKFVPFDRFMSCIHVIYRKALRLAISRFGGEEVAREVIDLYEKLLTQLAYYSRDKEYYTKQDMKDQFRYTTSYVDDVIRYVEKGDESYHTIIKNLCEGHVTSSYLYIHENVRHNYNQRMWKVPNRELLVCYQDDKKFVSLPPGERMISRENIFRNPYLPDRRFTFVVSPLFYSDEHFGILFTELPREYFYYLNWVALRQICYALKMQKMLNDQNAVHIQLQDIIEKVRKNNDKLQNISVSDALTELLNRRGFMDQVTKQLVTSSNFGKKAVFIFADVNNLKEINDHYGHEEGDFTLKKIGEVLKRSFRNSDIIARIGGDEFAIFAYTEADEFTNVIRSRVNRLCDNYNKTKQKPYLISICMGIYEFVCVKGNSITELMNRSDLLLYEDKKMKPKHAIREWVE